MRLPAMSATTRFLLSVGFVVAAALLIIAHTKFGWPRWLPGAWLLSVGVPILYFGKKRMDQRSD